MCKNIKLRILSLYFSRKENFVYFFVFGWKDDNGNKRSIRKWFVVVTLKSSSFKLEEMWEDTWEGVCMGENEI